MKNSCHCKWENHPDLVKLRSPNSWGRGLKAGREPSYLEQSEVQDVSGLEINESRVLPSSTTTGRLAASLQALCFMSSGQAAGQPLLLAPGHTFTDTGLTLLFKNTSSCSILEELSMPELARPLETVSPRLSFHTSAN